VQYLFYHFEQTSCHNIFRDVLVTARHDHNKEYLTNCRMLFKYFELVFCQLQVLRILFKFITIRLSYERKKKWFTFYLNTESINQRREFKVAKVTQTTARSTRDRLGMESSPGNSPKKNFVNRWVLRRWWKVDDDWADVTSSGRSFHVRGPTTGLSRLALVVNITGGTARRLVPAERRGRRPGKSATYRSWESQATVAQSLHHCSK